MHRFLVLISVFFSLAVPLSAQQPAEPIRFGEKKPTAVAVGPGGKIFVTAIDERDKKVSGAIMAIEKGEAVTLHEGLVEPMGIVAFQQWFYVADKTRVLRIDAKGKLEVFADSAAFPAPPKSLAGITTDIETGTLYVSDVGDEKDPSSGSAIFRITPNRKVSLVTNSKTTPELILPYGLTMDGQSNLLVSEARWGNLYRLRLSDKKIEKLAEGLGLCYCVTKDHHGRVFVSTAIDRKLYVIPRPGEKPVVLAEGADSVYGICLDQTGKQLLVADAEGRKLITIPIRIPGYEVDETPFPFDNVIAFPNLQWSGWKAESDSGKIVPFRPVLLTHAGDGSNRIFVGTQQGVVQVFPNDQKATKSTIFLDLQDRVTYNDNTNEEGFLGLAFHPKYKDNGEFFVFYTTKKTELANVVSRFKVSKDDPNRADPNSEEILLTFKKPFWNHDGGTLCFGPDGFLYITHGDGGLANDPYDNGQNLKSHLGKILRIDVDHKDGDKPYAIPKDNPFAGKADARPEIWAYGLRNIWRMSFDRKTGQLWAADVGQNLFEEIDLIKGGGNYGWNRREGLHPFGPRGSGISPDFVEPIWEYDHEVGKSITGGHVYRGSRLPELAGHYIYGDYVSCKFWALRYDEGKGRVVANRPLKDRNLPIYSFGEDEKGEIYWLTSTIDGKGIYWFVK
jgi:glucose/arabinose dehydrogenase